MSLQPFYSNPEIHFSDTKQKWYQLFNGDASGDLGPQSSKLDRRHQLLGVSVHVGVQHEAAEGGAEVKGQRLVHHAQEDELNVQLLGNLVYGQILTVQAHAGKELQLVPDRRERTTLRLLPSLTWFRWRRSVPTGSR